MNEIEKKYIVKGTVIEVIEETDVKINILQTYIENSDNAELRIRQSIYEFSDIYHKTKKIGNGFKREEIEEEITSSEYEELYSKRISGTLPKIRYVFRSDVRFVKEIILDVYEHHLPVIEIEFEDIKLTDEMINFIPGYLKKYIIKDVTGLKEYSNKQRAFDIEDLRKCNG